MRTHGRAVLYGFFVWLLPFVVSLGLFPLKVSWPVLFDSIMPVVVAVATVVCLRVYARDRGGALLYDGAWLGVLWIAINWTLDLLMFSWGPMRMTLVGYFADIGLTYLMIPVITASCALPLRRTADAS